MVREPHSPNDCISAAAPLMKPLPVKPGLHPRNRFREGYNYRALTACAPTLRPFVKQNIAGEDTIDYANPDAVKALNQALLRHAYGLKLWDLPTGYLCPPVPGRSDYLHALADLLANGGPIPQGPTVKVLDIGTGANVIYPLIGASEYGWRFVGADIDPVAVQWAAKTVGAHPQLAGLIECRLQRSPQQCFSGVITSSETFAVSMCNPPFHASAAAAAEGTDRKLHNLGGRRTSVPVLNFGGKAGELWCPGGELAFVSRMITQSADRPQACIWFTSLISKREHLQRLTHALREVKVADVKTIEMEQGQKQSRILAWTFFPPEARKLG